MSVEPLNLENVPTETTVTNLELDKKDSQEPGMTIVTVQGKEIPIPKIKELSSSIPPGTAAEGDHDGRDGDPELVNFLMDEKDKYIKVEIRADIVDGKPVIKEDGKYLIWAKFLRPTWKLDNILKNKRLGMTQEGTVVLDNTKYNENLLRYCLKEWNLPLQLIFGFDLDNNAELKNIDKITSETGVHPIILNELLNNIKEE